MERPITGILVGKGQEPKPVQVCPSDLASILGDGEIVWLGLHGLSGQTTLVMSTVMLCLKQDHDFMVMSRAHIPRLGVICCVDLNDLVSVPARIQEMIINRYRKIGEEMFYIGGVRDRGVVFAYTMYPSTIPPPDTGNAAHQRKNRLIMWNGNGKESGSV